MAFEQTFSQYLNNRNREETEPRKKLRKRRSIRFFQGSYFRLSSKSTKSHLNWAPKDVSSKPSFVALSDSSPNYMKSTSCFNAKKESSQEEIDFDEVNSLVSSSCGSSDLLALPSISMSDDAAMPQHHPSSTELSDASPLSLKDSRYSEERKSYLQASPHDSESSYDSSDNSKSSNYAQSKSIYSGKKSLQTLSRSSSNRGVRILIKKSSFKPKRAPLKYSQMSEETNVEKATCSSIIKDSRFPEHVELEPGQTESERISFVKVCPYHHCSLNGHCHDPPLPKKPFLRRKRPSSLPQIIGKTSTETGPGIKRSADKKKGLKKHQMASNAEPSVHEDSLREFEESNGIEMVLDGPSDPGRNNQEEDIPEATFELKETSFERYNQNTEVEKSNAAPANSLVVHKLQFGKRKPISMWHVIHKHMVSGLAAEEETKPLQGTDEGRQVEEAEMAITRKSSDVSLEFSDSDIGNSNHNKENQDIEIRKLFAIKLVREAIEKILLPEVQDQLSETQSITNDSVEGQELSEKNHQAPDEGCHGESAKVQVHVDDSIPGQEIKKPETKLGKKSPSNWSNLKKWILLQRFVKELEKVRKLNHVKPRQLQLETDPAAEKVSLRRQNVDEKKKSEEWMLDYALQQVVSQLAPTQRRKVALLVKAFETVVPPQEDCNIQVTSKANASVSQAEDSKLKARDNVASKPDVEWERSSACVEHRETESQLTPMIDQVQLPTDLNLKNSSSQDVALDKSRREINVEELSCFKTESFDGGSESYSRNEEFDVAGDRSFTTQTETCDIEVKSEAGGEKVPASNENTADNSRRKPELELHECTNLSPNSELSHGDLLPSTNGIELGDAGYKADESLNTSECLMVDKIEKTEATENSVYSSLEQEEASAWKETRSDQSIPEPIDVRVLPQLDIKSLYKESEAAQSPMNKQNYMGMWHLVCQHVVSSIATKLGSQLLEEDDEDAENGSKSSSPPETPGRPKDPPKHEERNQKAEFSRSQVLKLVKEAVQEILSPEIQDDSSDTLSVSSENFQDQELSEKDQSEVVKQSIPNSAVLSEQNTREFDRSEEGSSLGEQKESTNDVNTIQDCKKVVSVDKSISSAPPKPKNWSKLKKLILLKRSIKAMEKARKLNFPPQQLLPLPSDQEPEKVDLRHQMLDERRKAEQWMLDYAVQHIVTKLTPARKRRVAMLVEAFEAVVPLPEV